MIYFAKINICGLKVLNRRLYEDPIWRPILFRRCRPEREVYFIKIGSSVDPGARMNQLASDYERKVSLLATLPGGPEEERAMHDRFDHLRIERCHGQRTPEWFYPTRELLDFIGSIQNREKTSDSGLDMVMTTP